MAEVLCGMCPHCRTNGIRVDVNGFLVLHKFCNIRRNGDCPGSGTKPETIEKVEERVTMKHIRYGVCSECQTGGIRVDTDGFLVSHCVCNNLHYGDCPGSGTKPETIELAEEKDYDG